MENINFPLLLKIFALIFLTWIYNPYNEDTFGKSIEKKQKNEGSSYVFFKRVLSKEEMQREFKYTNVRENLSHNRIGKDIKSKLEFTSTYGDKKRVGLNKLDAYKKGYMDRYNKKTGLAKLDCYFEKKVFDKIDYINGLAEKWQRDKNSFKKKLFKKYGIFFWLFGLLPLLGLIFPAIFGNYNLGDGLLSWCGEKPEQHRHTGNRDCGLTYYDPELIKGIYILNSVIFYIISFIIVFVFIYAFIKVIKYERLKAGKEKMSRKEYFDFCKEVFKNK